MFCKKTEQKRFQNSFKRVDRLRRAYIRQELMYVLYIVSESKTANNILRNLIK